MIDFSTMHPVVVQFAVACLAALTFAVLLGAVAKLAGKTSTTALRVLAPALRGFDDFLLHHVGAWFGTHDVRFLPRWTKLIGLMLLTASVGMFSPFMPLSVAALLLGILGVAAVVRRWAVDEHERSLGVEPAYRRVKIDEDLNAEAIVAVSSVILLGSVLAFKMRSYGLFVADAPGVGLLDYSNYILDEVIQALPFLGNIEVLDLKMPTVIEPVKYDGSAIAFVIRLSLDVLVIGALVKFIEISSRVAFRQKLARFADQLANGRTDKALPELERLAAERRDDVRQTLEAAMYPAEDANADQLAAAARTASTVVRVSSFYLEGGLAMMQRAVQALRGLHNRLRDRPIDLTATLTAFLFADALRQMADRAGGADGLVAVREAIAIQTGLLTSYERLKMPADVAATNSSLGDSHWLLGRKSGGSERQDALAESVDRFRRAIAWREGNGPRGAWAGSVHGLAATLSEIALDAGEPVRSRAYEEAFRLNRELLDYFHGTGEQLLWARASHNLASDLSQYAARLAGPDRERLFGEAIAQFEATLAVRTRHNAPYEWVVTQNNMASAYFNSGDRADDDAQAQILLRKSIEMNEEIVSSFEMSDIPYYWILAQHNLSSSLLALAGHVPAAERTALLERSLVANTAALSFRTAETAPVDWALTMQNRGSLYHEIGGTLEGVAAVTAYDEAIRCFDNAMQVRTLEAMPTRYAASLRNRSSSLLDSTMYLSGQSRRDRLLESAEGFARAGRIFAEQGITAEVASCAEREETARWWVRHDEGLPASPEPVADEGLALARNSPCPCGSGKRYKHCHGAH